MVTINEWLNMGVSHKLGSLSLKPNTTCQPSPWLRRTCSNQENIPMMILQDLLSSMNHPKSVAIILHVEVMCVFVPKYATNLGKCLFQGARDCKAHLCPPWPKRRLAVSWFSMGFYWCNAQRARFLARNKRFANLWLRRPRLSVHEIQVYTGFFFVMPDVKGTCGANASINSWVCLERRFALFLVNPDLGNTSLPFQNFLRKSKNMNLNKELEQFVSTQSYKKGLHFPCVWMSLHTMLPSATAPNSSGGRWPCSTWKRYNRGGVKMGDDTIWWRYVFEMGWFNHQLENGC